MVQAAPTAALGLVGEVISRRAIRTVFQPLVHLPSLEVVGFEALMRGPSGTPFEAPLRLLEAARQIGRLEELDWLCAASAMDAASRAHLHPSMTIFLNISPSTLKTPCPDDLTARVARARENLRVVAEIDSASILDDPGEVLEAVRVMRADSWGFALDNLGGDIKGLAMATFLHPDVLKVNLDRLERLGPGAQAEVVNSIREYAERTGAVILAQGIEDEEDLLAARIAGALYGQGWRYGEPGDLPEASRMPHHPFPLRSRPDPEEPETPFEILSRRHERASGDRRLLSGISKHLEFEALADGSPLVVLVCLSDVQYLTASTIRRLEHIAEKAIFVAVMAPSLEQARQPKGTRARRLSPTDALASEWAVVTIGPRFAAALAARASIRTPADENAAFDYVLTYDREAAGEAARALLLWLHGGHQVEKSP